MKVAFAPKIAHEPSNETEDTAIFNLIDWLNGDTGMDEGYVEKAQGFVVSIKGRAWRTLTEKQLTWLTKLQAQQNAPVKDERDFYNEDPYSEMYFV